MDILFLNREAKTINMTIQHKDNFNVRVRGKLIFWNKDRNIIRPFGFGTSQFHCHHFKLKDIVQPLTDLRYTIWIYVSITILAEF